MQGVTLLLGYDLDWLPVGEYFDKETHVGHISSFLDANLLGFRYIGGILLAEVVGEGADDLVEGTSETFNF